jgi:hypothetical protein
MDEKLSKIKREMNVIMLLIDEIASKETIIVLDDYEIGGRIKDAIQLGLVNHLGTLQKEYSGGA